MTTHTSQALEAAKTGIYVASRASIPERGQMWRDLRESGISITSTWIDEDGPKASRDLSGLWVRIADEIRRSSGLLLYVEPSDFPLKGAFIEVGMALAGGCPVVIVAPDVILDGRNCRPLGSWVKHPLVSFAPTIRQALAALSHVPDGEGNCFECGHELHAPFCPACNPEMVKPTPPVCVHEWNGMDEPAKCAKCGEVLSLLSPTPQDGWRPDQEAAALKALTQIAEHPGPNADDAAHMRAEIARDALIAISQPGAE